MVELEKKDLEILKNSLAFSEHYNKYLELQREGYIQILLIDECVNLQGSEISEEQFQRQRSNALGGLRHVQSQINEHKSIRERDNDRPNRTNNQ